jgi:hypothetical protein
MPAVYGGVSTVPTYQTTTQSPDPGPVKISASVGKTASVDGIDYTVTSIQLAGPKYKQMYDQRSSTIHARWKTDSLVVINMEETNRGSSPVAAMLPASSDITIFDSNKIGYHATYLDVRQPSDVAGEDSNYDFTPSGGGSGLLLGPGGTIHFAVIASAPMGDQITTVMMNVPAHGGSMPSGAVVTISR